MPPRSKLKDFNGPNFRGKNMATLFQKKSIAVLLGLALTAAASLVSAAPIYGSTDNSVAQETLSNSGDNTETAWAESKTGQDLTWIGKKEFEKPADAWMADGNILYLDLKDLNVAYFIVKLGQGKGKDGKAIVSHHLFENVSSLQYAAVDFSGISEFNVGKISHITLFGGTPVSVPEPSTLALFGLGVAGMIATRRRRN